ncbi:MAG: tetratricopeptide repeat protein, partial [Gemmatimonadaceae bacterium]
SLGDSSLGDSSLIDTSLDAPPSPTPVAELIDLRSAAEHLRERIAEHQDDWGAHRDLGLTILADAGDGNEAMRSLATAMTGFERAGNFTAARDVAREIVAIEPQNLTQHQKHVEFAVKSGERGSPLVAAYGGLAEALLRVNLADKARAIFLRIVDLAPEHARAREMLEKIPEPAHGSLYVTGVMLAVPTMAKPDGRLPTPKAAPAQPSVRDDKFVNLADWLRDDEPPKSTRMVADEPEPNAAANSDFAEMLSKFKQGVAANVDEGDHESHYDLGIAYKEMGLLDEAIAEFQKALRSTENRVRTYEALGQCFVEKKQFQIALTILGRALAGGVAGDDLLVGVLYLLGVANEALGKRGDAASFFGRVVAVDVRFRDAGARLAAMERAAS